MDLHSDGYANTATGASHARCFLEVEARLFQGAMGNGGDERLPNIQIQRAPPLKF